MFNPIIPVFDEVPIWWDKAGWDTKSAKEILNGYIDYFEPDVLVECEPGLGANTGYDSSRIIKLNNLLERNSDNICMFGQDMFDVYRELFETEYKFQQRFPHSVTMIKAVDELSKRVTACLFGAFHENEVLEYFPQAFKKVFGDAEVTVDGGEALAKIYTDQLIGPLRITNGLLEVQELSFQDPAIFVFDATKPHDLIDFWNLRVLHNSGIVGVPVQWLEEMGDFCKQFIIESHKPRTNNLLNGFIRARIMFARSISEDQGVQLFRKYLLQTKAPSAQQHWYPSFEQHSTGGAGLMTPKPAMLSFGSKSRDVACTTGTDLTVEPSLPSFVKGGGRSYQWASVFNLESYYDDVNAIYPVNLRRPSFPKSNLTQYLIPTTEGLVAFSSPFRREVHLPIHKRAEAIGLWLESENIQSVQSDAGRATNQIIESFEGVYSLWTLANISVLKMLDSIASNSSARTINAQAFKSRLDSYKRKPDKLFELLVNHGVVELGAQIKCKECGHPTWYDLKQLDNVLQCELCRTEYQFPIHNPKREVTWAYRVIGPFALPNFAKGGYAAALSIRFFTVMTELVTGMQISWSAGRELTYPDNRKIEADYIMLIQRKTEFDRVSAPLLLFGESKTLAAEAFVQKDIDNMKALAKRHPGAALVFSCLKSSLSDNEVAMLRKLALWGRETDPQSGNLNAMVVVLTGLEILQRGVLTMTWNEASDKHRTALEYANKNGGLHGVFNLADATQHLYLGLDYYQNWYEDHIEEYAAARKAE
ncbi:hypothetical protein [Shewanella colwelliana]|uniref:hypothetical protein n=1 Tax=Shewanella colwelliana TaxID=23 RepID=UPI0022B070DB|nr:hypothetical protein [Shewanella colwelliana]MCZ4337640.1 hypothetical protein [Shewanella colwelliana]